MKVKAPTPITAEIAKTKVHSRFRRANWVQRGAFVVGVAGGALAGASHSSSPVVITEMAAVPTAMAISYTDRRLAVRSSDRTLRDFRYGLDIRHPKDSQWLERDVNAHDNINAAAPALFGGLGTMLGVTEATSEHSRYHVGVYSFAGAFLLLGAGMVVADNHANNELAKQYEHAIATLENANAANVSPLRRRPQQ